MKVSAKLWSILNPDTCSDLDLLKEMHREVRDWYSALTVAIAREERAKERNQQTKETPNA